MVKKIFFLIAFLLSNNLLARVPVSEGPYYAGGIVGTFLGFGIGHAIQDRYLGKGWIFTLGEGASAGTFLLADKGTPLSTIGGLVFIGFRIWEIVDLWVQARPVKNFALAPNLDHFNKKPLKEDNSPKTSMFLFSFNL